MKIENTEEQLIELGRQLVYYDGRLTPLSQASAFAEEDVKRQQDFLKEYPKQSTGLPGDTPVAEWDRQKLDLAQRFKTFFAEADAACSEQDAKAAEFALLGFTEPIDLAQLPEGAFTFDQVLTQDWCRYTKEKWFVKFLQNFGYPESFIVLRVITRIGYEKLVAKEQKNQRARKTQNKQTERAQRATVGNQVPEPNKQ
jgi:hypothetical protein